LLINHLLSHLMPPVEENKKEELPEEEEEFVIETLDPDYYPEEYTEQVIEEEVYVDEEEYPEPTTKIIADKIQKIRMPDVIYKCTHCDYQRASEKAIYSHFENEHDENNSLSCPYAPECKNIFKNQKVLDKHVSWHKMNDAKELKQMKKLSNANRYSCDYCSKSYAHYHNMKRHVIEHIEGQKKRYKKMVLCDFCTQLVPSERLKRHHYTFHSDEKLFQCKVCGKDFKHAESLRNHMDGHENKPRYKCEYCGKAFFNLSNYKTHLYRHTEPDRFKCTVCFERYGSAKSLREHFMLKHENLEDKEKMHCPFDGCEKFFYLKNLLTAHVRRVHFKREESPQPCPYCKYVANSKKNIQRHKWRVHKVKTRNQKVFAD
jgi:hypothetical protein